MGVRVIFSLIPILFLFLLQKMKIYGTMYRIMTDNGGFPYLFCLYPFSPPVEKRMKKYRSIALTLLLSVFLGAMSLCLSGCSSEKGYDSGEHTFGEEDTLVTDTSEDVKETEDEVISGLDTEEDETEEGITTEEKYINTDPEDDYTVLLMSQGFPKSYAVQLAELHKKHPLWVFEPVTVTEMKPEYTWNYIIQQEMAPRRNLVTTSTWAPSGKNALYSPYYDETNTALYDSGWRQASRAAVEYFMDPRNFLNSVDIFMFETLGFNEEMHTPEAVEDALRGTFMSKTKGTVDGVNTYASLIYEKGREYGINPVYIANRILMEQGTDGNSPLSKGTVGDVLWGYYSGSISSSGKLVWGGGYENNKYTEAELKSRNGLYNYFCMGASGTGLFAIYMNASIEAEKEGWTSRAASISGGIAKVSELYIKDHQDTPYFQKFNVHPSSSRNFWGQYMQDISGALIGGRRGHDDYKDAGRKDEAHIFVIPVYGGMPSEPCADPAKGRSYYSPSR